MDRDETGMYRKLLTQGFQNWFQISKWARDRLCLVNLKTQKHEFEYGSGGVFVGVCITVCIRLRNKKRKTQVAYLYN